MKTYVIKYVKDSKILTWEERSAMGFAMVLSVFEYAVSSADSICKITVIDY